MKDKFIFYFPVSEIGGIHILIKRFIEYANILENYECIVIDNKNGTLYEMLDKDDLKYVKIYKSNSTWRTIREAYNVKEYTLILMSGGGFSDIMYDVKKDIENLKVLVYLVHPETFLNFYRGCLINKLSFGDNNLKKFYLRNIFGNFTKVVLEQISILDNNNSIAFMDKENLNYSEKLFDYKFNSNKILPIPINSIKQNVWNKNNNNNFIWLGRLEKSKSKVLQVILRDYKEYIIKNDCREAKFIIIGDGDNRFKIEKIVLDLGIKSNVEFKGSIFSSNLKEELLKANVVFAMGTSALECAAIGIPTVLVDWYKYVPNSINYRWLYTTDGFTLGRVIEKGTKVDIQNSFQGIIDDLNKNYREISIRSHNYSKNHEISSVYKMLCEYSRQIQGSINDIDCYKLYTKYNKIFTVKVLKKLGKI